MFKRIFFIFFVSFFLFSVAKAVKIETVNVIGLQRLTKEAIVSYAGISIGVEFTDNLASDYIKKLYTTGLFSDITLGMKGTVLEITVKENPLIIGVYFESNKEIKDEAMIGEVTSIAGSSFSATKVQSDVQRILDVYRRSGFYNATVTPRVIIMPYNRVNLIFEIYEGDRSHVYQIRFFGNKDFSDSDLSKIISTKTYSFFFEFINNGDNYDPDRVAFDAEMLRRYYINLGYLDYASLSTTALASLDNSFLSLTYMLEEGDRYRIGEVSIRMQHPDLPLAPFEKEISSMSDNDWYSQQRVDAMAVRLNDLAISLGHPFVRVEPDIRPNKDTLKANVVYIISDAPKRFVNKVTFAGNTRTQDEVIRRELRYLEGSPYENSAMDRSRQRIYNLGYFSKVNGQPISTSLPDKYDILYEVEEAPTGSINASIGYSTVDLASFQLSYTEQNLGGTGMKLNLTANYAELSHNFSATFVNPYFMGYPLSQSNSVFYNWYEDNGRGFDSLTQGASTGISYALNEYWRQSWTYSLRGESIENVDELVNEFYVQEGTQIASTISQGLTADYRNNSVYPSSGFLANWTIEFAGLNPAEYHNIVFKQYIKNTIRYNQYQKLFIDDLVLSLKLEAGVIEGYDDYQVNGFDRFYLGGPSLRGFAVAGVGPRAVYGGTSLGGNYLARGSLQLDFPVPGVPNYGLLLHVFYDAGTLTGVDGATSQTVLDSGLIRSSYGFGFLWRSPMGPIGIDFAVPLKKEPYDITEQVFINIGSTF